jgi:hypothetical protein
MILIEQLQQEALSVLIGDVSDHHSGSAIGFDVSQIDGKRVDFRVLASIICIKSRQIGKVLRLRR